MLKLALVRKNEMVVKKEYIISLHRFIATVGVLGEEARADLAKMLEEAGLKLDLPQLENGRE